MHVEVLTPRKKEFEGEAETIILSALSGEIAVLPGHAPLISVLGPGRIKIKTANEEIFIQISGGILQVAGGSATILLKNFLSA